MRLEPVFGPDAGHRHVREIAQFGGQLARGPVRGPIDWLAWGGPRQHFGLDSIGHFIALAPRVTGEQPRQPIRGNALAPASDVAVTALELGANLRSGQSLGPQQNQAGLSSLIGASLPCPRLPLQFHAFACGQFHHALQRPDDTPIYTLQATRRDGGWPHTPPSTDC